MPTRTNHYAYLTGDKAIPPRERKQRWKRLPAFPRASEFPAQNYVLHDDLKEAVNVAITLGKPILLTGEPGTGKSQLARYIAWEFDLEPRLKFVTKSTTIASDLFYNFDVVGRFNAARSERQSINPVRFIDYQALGLAVLYSRRRPDIGKFVPRGFKHPGQRRSVVLIDEIDKAPRDVPNDVLDQIEALEFSVPEIGSEAVISADRTMLPIVVVTSNSEKALPDAFLRRCVYYDIPPPNRDLLESIVASQIGADWVGQKSLLGDLLDIYFKARQSRFRIAKRPATSELLDCLLYLTNRFGAKPGDRLRDKPDWVDPLLTTLFKRTEDERQARAVIKEWQEDTG